MIRPRRSRRQEALRQAWLAQANQWPDAPWPCAETADTVANRRNDTATAAFSQKLPADDPRYKTVVAEPTMRAVDGMPAPFRALVHAYGYVDVYRAWRRNWPVSRIVAQAEGSGGLFLL